MREGEPALLELRRFHGDEGLRGQQQETCCDCGMVHLFTYEIVRDDKSGAVFIQKRAYRLKDGKLRARPGKKGKRAKK